MATILKASSSPSAGHSERPRVRAMRVAFAGLAVLLGLAACKNVLNDDEESFHTRIVNLIEDSPTVQYKIDTTIVASATYQGSSSLNGARPGSHSVSFQVLRPQSLVKDDTTDPIDLPGTFDRTYTQNTDYTIVAYGKLDDVKTMVIEAPSDPEDVDEEKIEISVVNVAPNMSSVEVFVTAPEAHINSPESLGIIQQGGRTAARTLQLFQRADVTDDEAALFTDLIFELRDPATGTTLFTSGSIRVNEQTRILLAVTKNIGPGPSTVQMMGLDGISGMYTNIDDQAVVRFVHTSADSPPLDIIRGSSLNTPIAENIAYRDRSDYVHVPDGEVDLIGTPADATGLVFLFLEEFQASVGLSYSAYAVGPLATVDAQVLTDTRRSIPTQGSFRFLNAAPSVEDEDGLDLYVTLPGQTLDFDSSDDTDTTDDAGGFRRAAAFGYRGTTDYFTLKPGTYQVRFMDTGTSRVVMDTTITVPAGGVQTYVLNDDLETAELELMPVDDAMI
jgi:hypothetical protein